MKFFNAALCDTCAEPGSRLLNLRIGKPRSLRAAGVIFFGTPYRMGAALPVPERTPARRRSVDHHGRLGRHACTRVPSR